MDEIRTPPVERLPDLRLPSASGGAPVPLVQPGGRRVPVIVAVHAADCADCRAFAQALAAAEAELREWGAHVVVVVPGEVDEAARFADGAGVPFPVVADADRKLWTRMGMEGAAAIVADPWGEVRMRHAAGAAHELPAPAELVDWARFVAIQCPECEGEAL
ncbi:MAG TPA: redoxin domain-containing protein [Longimicrobium sp.]|nr:redoxin domain-containing protein [Longimicrobium sp.]